MSKYCRDHENKAFKHDPSEVNKRMSTSSDTSSPSVLRNEWRFCFYSTRNSTKHVVSFLQRRDSRCARAPQTNNKRHTEEKDPVRAQTSCFRRNKWMTVFHVCTAASVALGYVRLLKSFWTLSLRFVVIFQQVFYSPNLSPLQSLSGIHREGGTSTFRSRLLLVETHVSIMSSTLIGWSLGRRSWHGWVCYCVCDWSLQHARYISRECDWSWQLKPRLFCTERFWDALCLQDVINKHKASYLLQSHDFSIY